MKKMRKMNGTPDRGIQERFPVAQQFPNLIFTTESRRNGEKQ
jgi:hypothetical protein